MASAARGCPGWPPRAADIGRLPRQPRHRSRHRADHTVMERTEVDGRLYRVKGPFRLLPATDSRSQSAELRCRHLRIVSSGRREAKTGIVRRRPRLILSRSQ